MTNKNELLQMTKLRDHNSTFANRMLHKETNQIIIGAWAIDLEGNVKDFPSLVHVRVAATAEHLFTPETTVRFNMFND